MTTGAVAIRLSGRAPEQSALREAVEAGLAGRPRAVLVHGEAGIGKTTLVRDLCDQAASEGTQVLWGQSLRFGTVEAIYHPLVLALEAWLAGAGQAGRAALLEDVPAASLVLPSLGAVPTGGPSMLLTVLDALVNWVVALGPTVLVVDDVQWADPATRDALTYLVAGFTRQRLALVTTHRDEAARAEDFQHWLGNIRRLPATEELPLDRLDRGATGDQIRVLLGTTPSARLVDQVFERSGGNPYFSELLVRRGDLDVSELPDDLPDELNQALLDAWRGLSAPTRETARILAIGGRPTSLATLAALAETLGVPRLGSMQEAIDAGVLARQGDQIWFRHPLLARVLAESYLPGEDAPVHAAWAAHLAQSPSDGVDELRRLGDLATHHQHAGDGANALLVLLGAADYADELGAPWEAAGLLARAADLWPESPDPDDVVAQAAVLERAGRACRNDGRISEAFGFLTAARDLVLAEDDPLRVSALTLHLAQLGVYMGDSLDSYLAGVGRAVDLSREHPDSPEYAKALATQAVGYWWKAHTEAAAETAEEAVSAARRSGSTTALCKALSARAQVWVDLDPGRSEQDSLTAREQAKACGDPTVVADALVDRLVLLGERGDLRALLAHMRETYACLTAHGPMAEPADSLATILLDTGELNEAEVVVRSGLAAKGSRTGEAGIRLAAAQLAARRGIREVARNHLARAQEILPDLVTNQYDCVPAVVELLLAEGDLRGALVLVEQALPLCAAEPRVLDRLLLAGARVAAELVRAAADDRDDAAVRRHRNSLEQLIATRENWPGTPFTAGGDSDHVTVARKAIFDAERDRAEGETDQPALWRAAATACATASMGWEQHNASYRLAAALIASGTAGIEAPGLLRAVHEYACLQGAQPLQAEVEELAALARISLSGPAPRPTSDVPAAFVNLTEREAEVLGYLVANRTNAEIAQALFISDKTVSVHVSNLLRKTDTHSRREVAALAGRLGWALHD